MNFFKINSIPGISWPPVPRPQVAAIWNTYQQIDKTQWLSAEEIQHGQLEQLNYLLKHCYDNVPYYKKILDGCGIGNKPLTSFEEFRKLPFLTRKLYQIKFNEIQATKLPNLVRSKDPIYTSGTSGVPISVYKTDLDAVWWNALTMRDFEWNGMDPMKKLASIRLIAMNEQDKARAFRGLTTPYWLPPINGFPLFQSGPAYGLDSRQEPYSQLGWLVTVNPSYLISMPSNLEILASIYEEGRFKLPALEIIQTIGEPLTSELKKRLETVFNVKTKNLYSTNETGYVASSCPTGEGLHVHSENVYAEVLNTKNQPCKPGETGRLVITSLTNFANPFIRYDILDTVTLADQPCSCGRGLPLWKYVEGRRHPMLFLKGGKRKISTGLMLGIRKIGASINSR